MPARAIDYTADLDFTVPLKRITALDGASVCQFHEGERDSHDRKPNVIHRYDGLTGFPDDGATEFGEFCDTAFSASADHGMALHHLWATPCATQTPAGSVGDTFDPASWTLLDFSMYEPVELGEAKYNYNDSLWNLFTPPAKGHTAVMYRAMVKRAHADNLRVLCWTDVHFDYPRWLWANGGATDSDRKPALPEENWEEAALHNVFLARYLVARHGIPIHSVSFMNEPGVIGDRHNFSPAQSVRFQPVLRARLDEAGLSGVRCIAPHYKLLSHVRQVRDYLDANPQYQPYVDTIEGHHPDGPAPRSSDPRVETWCGSGPRFISSNSHDPSAEQVDDIIHTTLMLQTARNYDFFGIWQLSKRISPKWNPDSSYDPVAAAIRHKVAGGATVFPYVRPGMHFVAGSSSVYSDSLVALGFGGRGHPEVVVVLNDNDESREVEINLVGLSHTQMRRYQATETTAKVDLGDVDVSAGTLTLVVPAHSVTSLVAPSAASTRPRVYAIVGDEASRTSGDDRVIAAIQSLGVEVVVLSEQLTESQSYAHLTKRHPVDPFGAACYVLAPSVARASTLQAFDAVQAPVVLVNDGNESLLGLLPGSVVQPGAALDMRRVPDPPASMLIAGLPLSTGYRADLEEAAVEDTVARAVRLAIETGGAVKLPFDPTNLPPEIIEGPDADPNPVTGTTTELSVVADDPNGDPLFYAWSSDGPAPISFSGNGPTTTAVFDVAGLYEVSVTVRDDRGGSASGTVSVNAVSTATRVKIVTP